MCFHYKVQFLTRDSQHKPLDIITLFHKASSPASMRVAAALRQASAAASETSTEDQASDHTAQSNAVRRPEFKLEITETPPTADQLQTILEYVGKQRISSIVKGATDQADALRRFKENAESFQRPVVCAQS
jgi:arsenate reductase-like glutaredoxin family protein